MKSIKKMGEIKATKKIIFSNSKKNKINNSIISYSVSSKDSKLQFSIKENKIHISNGIVVDIS